MSEITDFMNLPDYVPPVDPRDATIAILTTEVARLHERLEDNHVFVWDKATDKMLRQEVEPGSVPDGIECRNDTIKIQDENLDRLRSANATLTAALEEARGALEAFQKLHDEIMSLAEEAFREGDMDCADPSAWAKSCDWDDLRRARTALATINAALGRKEP